MSGQVIDFVATRVIQLKKHKAAIEKALKFTHGTYTYDDVCKFCLFGDYYLFENNDSFLIGYKVQYPQESAFHVFLAGGRLEELVPMYDTVYRFALALGCTKGTFTGRRGWKPMMEQMGWQEVSTTFFVDLSPDMYAPQQLELPLQSHSVH